MSGLLLDANQVNQTGDSTFVLWMRQERRHLLLEDVGILVAQSRAADLSQHERRRSVESDPSQEGRAMTSSSYQTHDFIKEGSTTMATISVVAIVVVLLMKKDLKQVLPNETRSTGDHNHASRSVLLLATVVDQTTTNTTKTTTTTSSDAAIVVVVAHRRRHHYDATKKVLLEVTTIIINFKLIVRSFLSSSRDRRSRFLLCTLAVYLYRSREGEEWELFVVITENVSVN